MIAIKCMKMPNACTSTQETLGDIGVANCPLYNVCKHRDTIRTNYKPSDCPLIEIVTCKDCKNYVKGALDEEICLKGHELIHEDFYCADGERRNNDKNN